MVLIDIYKIPVAVSLAVVVGILALTMIVSVRTAGGSSVKPPNT
jgi:tellurite resistance protein TerC